MISPYGADKLNSLFIDDEHDRLVAKENARYLNDLIISPSAVANVVMLGSGYFTPLTGFMNKSDALSVAVNLYTESGLFWPIPIVNLIKHEKPIKVGKPLALRDPSIGGNPVIAIQDVESVEYLTDREINTILINIFSTTDVKHPGVATFLGLGKTLVAGPLRVVNFSYFTEAFPGIFETAQEIRNDIVSRGWTTVVAFQTRNPMHRHHEELCKIAKRELGVDGILIHTLLGRLKIGDIPAHIRISAIQVMITRYFPANSVKLSGYGFDMLYAGPREALLHAIFRQNAGCTHLIVGRDHAGVDNYYGPFDAQTVFDEDAPKHELQIQIFRADHTAYSKKLRRVVMMRDAPNHDCGDFVLLSGTRVRALLEMGKPLPVEFCRPEVAKILMEYYQKKSKE
mgnify:CR=1 FL=1|jgi:sulfate adenylyltransferase|tara:strand:- start:1451 stop:2644 length:1194 start_codon:yes stop_codon:yes gene_type:complete